MLPLYSNNSSSNKYVYPSSTQRAKFTKKWRKTYYNVLHQTKPSTFIIIVIGALVSLYFIISIASLARTPSSNAVPEFPAEPQENKRDEGEREQVNMNIVEEKTKETKVLYIEDISNQYSPGEKNLARRNQIKDAFVHAYGGFEKLAFGYDELRPVTNRTNASWGGFGVTIFDALDTILLMRLDEMFERALKFVLSINFEKDHDASVFEFTIRYIGGLLGAFELTKERPLLYQAKALADKLLPAFNTTSGIPYSIVNLKTGIGRNPTWNGKASILAEVGSIQLEFKYLSYHLNDPVYARKADAVYKILADRNKQDKREGLYPVYINPETGGFSSELVSLGGLGDSYYEYLLKRYILGGKKESMYRELYDESMQSVLTQLVRESYSPFDNRTYTFLGEYSNRGLVPEMDHLVCYVGGMLLLGATGETRTKHVEVGERLTETCYHMYRTMPTGFGPERVGFDPRGNAARGSVDDKMKRGFSVLSTQYKLRPETIEAIFYAWRFTGNPMYQEWSWEIFLALEKYCKTPSSYSGLMDVTNADGPQNDSMPSYFFAETFKYLFLIFSDTDVLPLDKYVFNTEAHPLGILP